ncbi:unnamed protein product [Durusdinium trenchii]|uniref:Protein kinase domain-containing protein n=1 Tax=Durusdinium trenchii TaxID=1381693 RepID=A0ABP0IF25_9DINO
MGAQCAKADVSNDDFVLVNQVLAEAPGLDETSKEDGPATHLDRFTGTTTYEYVRYDIDEATKEANSPTSTNAGTPLGDLSVYTTEEDQEEYQEVLWGRVDESASADWTSEHRLEEMVEQVCHEDLTFKTELCSTVKSTVCLVEWKGQMVVAKKIEKSLLTEVDPESIETRDISMREMLHELKILSTISHPCIVNVLGSGFERQQGPFFLTEYMAGGDVESYMQKQRAKSLDQTFKPGWSLAMQWILSTAEALAYLHGLPQPIIHRDLKPLNLLLTKELKLKVTDLGLSKVMPGHGQKASDPVKMTGGVGTWRYMAPEMVRHEHYTDRIDIYALALIAYFLLSGRQPFDSFCRGDVENILKAYLKGQEPRPELDMFTGSMEMRAFLQEAWHPEASRRPSAAECAERLAEISTHGLLHSVGVFSKNLKRNLQPFARSTTA